LRSILPVRCRSLSWPERVNDEENHCNRDARIGYVESGPGVKNPGRVLSEIEQEKVDHVAVKNTIGKISQDAGEQKRERDITPNIGCSPPDEESQNNDKCDRRNYDKESVVVSE